MLPAGYTWRPATVDDAPAVLAFFVDYNTALIGDPDCTVDDIRDQLTEPGLVVEEDTWLVHTAEGGLAGWGWVLPRGTGEYVDLEVTSTEPAVREWLFDRTMARASALAAAGGHAQTTVDAGVYRADTATADAAAARGFHQAATFYRMHIDHSAESVPDPVVPNGVTLRTGPGDEDFRRVAHDVLNTSFKGHFGWIAESFERWQAAQDAAAGFDWSQLTLAYLDGTPAAILLASDRFVEDENCGSVDDLGVLVEARGRGIAKFLLHTAFAADRAAGRAGTILHVDSNNTTGALRLYESVGMRAVLVIDKWCKTISP